MGTVDCAQFVPNRFKPNFCAVCTQHLSAHCRSAVTSQEHVRAALEHTAKGERTPSEVLPPANALYLGGFKGVTNAQWLQQKGITHVANTAKGLEMFGPVYIRAVAAAKEAGIQFLELDWIDSS